MRYEEDSEAALSAELNALVAVNAEDYYRTMVRHDAESWNVRDRHMVETLRRLAAPPRPRRQGDRLGAQHARRRRACNRYGWPTAWSTSASSCAKRTAKPMCVAIGFGTYRGTVIAATSWGAPMATMQVPPAQPGSWEELMHRAGAHDQILLLSKEDPILGHEVLGHRAIGVVYRPAS